MSLESVDMFVIARLDDDVAVADLYSCEIHYDAADGTEAGPTVEASWGSVASEPTAPATLGALDQALTEFGYRRTTDWHKRVTASGAVRYFANATIGIEQV
ncbi:hypothetical protein ACQPZ2_44050 (plasmid) [Nocardia pseudovaccinii]|uniref:hypothetical protein n=1 Tax=Nocardia pseudovaccinii TaxID=189540 RepID=UPI003D8E8AF5